MPHTPSKAVAHGAIDVAVLDLVLTFVEQQVVRYGVSPARRKVLARVLELTLLHVRLGTDAALLARLGELSADILTTSPPGRTTAPGGCDGP